MEFFIVKKKPFEVFIALTQILILFLYFTFNIVNVGEESGVALPLIGIFLILSIINLLFQSLTKPIKIYFHFFIFLLFIGWLCIRVIFDMHDTYLLKQLTIGTTGGILLFFLLGTFSRKYMNYIILSQLFLKIILVVFTIISLYIFFEYSTRLIRTDIFFIDDVGGMYQRPGNLYIMLFIMTSFCYLSVFSNKLKEGLLSMSLWFFIYTTGLVISLVNSQMIGSNAATANLLAVYLMTLVCSFLAHSHTVRQVFSRGSLSLPLSRMVFSRILQYSFLSLVVFGTILIIVIQISEFDITTTRLLGFGEGNTSVSSRVDILKNTGLAQLGYAPILGNVNVAYLATGDASRPLHNFIPNIWAELGLVGLVIFITLFVMLIKTLIVKIKRLLIDTEGFQQSMLNMWFLFILLYLFFYANIAVGKEWPVIWFLMGFSCSVFLSKRTLTLIKEVKSNGKKR